MKELSAQAEIVPTTLWMNEDQYKTLIACGRCTTCFSLLKYFWQKWQAEESEAQKQTPQTVPKPDTPDSPYYDTYTRLKTEWLKLKENPVNLMNRERV